MDYLPLVIPTVGALLGFVLGATLARRSAQSLPSAPHRVMASLNSLRTMPLVHPVVVVLEYVDGDVVARWPELDAWARGTTEHEAIRALGASVEDRYRSLRAADDLASEAARWKRVLDTLTQSHDPQ